MNEDIRQKEVRINIRVSADLKERFQNCCQAKKYNASAVVRTLLEKWLEENDTKQ